MASYAVKADPNARGVWEEGYGVALGGIVEHPHEHGWPYHDNAYLVVVGWNSITRSITERAKHLFRDRAAACLSPAAVTP